MATVIVGMLLMWIVGFGGSFIVNIMSGVAAAGSAAIGGGRHHAPSATAVPFFVGFGIVTVLLHLLAMVVNIVVSSFFTAGLTSFGLKVARGAPYAFGDLFGGGSYFLSVLVANLISSIAVGVGFILLIVPGVILALGLNMTLPLIVDRNLGPIDALSESWKLTEGSRLNLFIYWLIAGGLAIAGVCACGVGILLVVPLLVIGHAYIYLKLSKQPVADLHPRQAVFRPG